MRVAIITANLGGIDRRRAHVPQDLPAGVSVDWYYLDDSDVPPRPALSPRMQAKAFKMLGWQIAPDADVIIWLDASLCVSTPLFVCWMLDGLGAADAAFMPHPERRTVHAEVAFVATEMAAGNARLLERYCGEPFVDQLACYLSDPDFDPEAPLIAAGCFIFRPRPHVRAAMAAWLSECVRWTCQDQISLPYVLEKHRDVSIAWLGSGPYDCPHLEYTEHDATIAEAPVVSPHTVSKARADKPWLDPPPVVMSSGSNLRPVWMIECIESVASQTVAARHVYLVNAGMPGLDRVRAYVAAMPHGERVEIREIRDRRFWEDETVGRLDPETVVIDLGGDDFLLRDDAIEIVLAEHAGGALVTYGQFEPFPAAPWLSFRASAHTHEEVAAGSYRGAPWRATHLKTFRAGLAQAIRPEDLRNQHGEWDWLTGDQATMLPCLEMAAERATFIATPIYGYRVNNPASVHNSPERLAAQAEELAHLRSLPPYKRIEWPPR